MFQTQSNAVSPAILKIIAGLGVLIILATAVPAHAFPGVGVFKGATKFALKYTDDLLRKIPRFGDDVIKFSLRHSDDLSHLTPMTKKMLHLLPPQAANEALKLSARHGDDAIRLAVRAQRQKLPVQDVLTFIGKTAEKGINFLEQHWKFFTIVPGAFWFLNHIPGEHIAHTLDFLGLLLSWGLPFLCLLLVTVAGYRILVWGRILRERVPNTEKEDPA